MDAVFAVSWDLQRRLLQTVYAYIFSFCRVHTVSNFHWKHKTLQITSEYPPILKNYFKKYAHKNWTLNFTISSTKNKSHIHCCFPGYRLNKKYFWIYRLGLHGPALCWIIVPRRMTLHLPVLRFPLTNLILPGSLDCFCHSAVFVFLTSYSC